MWLFGSHKSETEMLTWGEVVLVMVAVDRALIGGLQFTLFYAHYSTANKAHFKLNAVFEREK